MASLGQDRELRKRIRDLERSAADTCIQAGDVWCRPEQRARVDDPDLQREYRLIDEKRARIEAGTEAQQQIARTAEQLAERDRQIRRTLHLMHREMSETRLYNCAVGKEAYAAYEAQFEAYSPEWERWRLVFYEVMRVRAERDELAAETGFLAAQLERQPLPLRVLTWLRVRARRLRLRWEQLRLDHAFKLAGAKVIEFQFAAAVEAPALDDLLTLLQENTRAADQHRVALADLQQDREALAAALARHEVAGADSAGRIKALDAEIATLEREIGDIQREVGLIGFMKGLARGLDTPALETLYRTLQGYYDTMAPWKAQLGLTADPKPGAFAGQRVDLGPTGVPRPPTEEELAAQEEAERAARAAADAETGFRLEPGAALMGARQTTSARWEGEPPGEPSGGDDGGVSMRIAESADAGASDEDAADTDGDPEQEISDLWDPAQDRGAEGTGARRASAPAPADDPDTRELFADDELAFDDLPAIDPDDREPPRGR